MFGRGFFVGGLLSHPFSGPSVITIETSKIFVVGHWLAIRLSENHWTAI